MPEIFNKPPLSTEHQIKLMRSRGLIIHDCEEAARQLSFISYYRLSGYAIFFENQNQGKREHQFKSGTSFNDIMNLYNFDRLLRLLVMDAIECIEVAVRTQICQHLSMAYYDSHWYLRKEIFNENFKFEKFLEDCQFEFSKSREIFARHYKDNYIDPILPPDWMLIEILSLGTWSVLYQNIKDRKYKKQIAEAFDLSPIELKSWLHSLT